MKVPAALRKMVSALVKSPRRVFALLLPIVLFLGGWWFGLPSDKKADAAEKASDTIWTCSMHPTVRQPNPGLCPICNMDLIPLQDEGGGGLREVSVSPEAAALLDLRVSPVRRAAANANLKLFGRIEYDERRITDVTARMGGRLDRLFVDFTGALVRKGDHLAEIYSPELFVAQKELIEGKRAFDRMKGSASPAVLDTRRRLLESAREKLRLLQLTDEQIATIETLDAPDPTLRIDSLQDGVVVDKLVSEGNYVKTGDSLLRVADLTRVWLMVEAYESDLPWLRYGQDVEFTVDSIPGEKFHGRIAFIDRELDAMRRIASVRVNVDNPSGVLKPGYYAKVTIGSRMTADGRVIDPSLAGKWISPMHPEIVKDGPGQCDICGMDLVPAVSLGFMAASEPASDPLLVPRSAVLQTGDRAIVYVRLPEEATPVFEGRQIVLGPAVGGEFIVREGLEEGELVVTRGAFNLDSELQIKGKPSMMSPWSGLEERPAHSAPEDLAGQWPPVLRSLHRFQQSVRDGEMTAAGSELKSMKSIVREIRTDSMQPDDLRIWNEFSPRLLGELTLAAEQIETRPGTGAGMVARAMEDAGRFLGLPWQGIGTSETDPVVVEALRQVIDAYLPVGKALAKDNDEAAKLRADRLAEVVASQSAVASGPLPAAAQALAGASDIKTRRAAFKDVSDALIALVRTSGIDQVGNLYVVHCPMAFEDGGDWLSAVPEVLNPYYGDEMLTCGSVTDTLSVGRGGPQKAQESQGMEESHQH